jgi:hypothetical protein
LDRFGLTPVDGDALYSHCVDHFLWFRAGIPRRLRPSERPATKWDQKLLTDAVTRATVARDAEAAKRRFASYTPPSRESRYRTRPLRHREGTARGDPEGFHQKDRKDANERDRSGAAKAKELKPLRKSAISCAATRRRLRIVFEPRAAR